MGKQMIRRFLVRVLVNAVALWAADELLGGFSVAGGIVGFLIAGGLLAVLNTFIRPLLKLVAMPLIALTLGLFTFVINAGILWFVGRVLDQVTIAGLTALALTTLIVTAVNMLLAPRANE
jgi:putative membrane protein